MKFQKERVYTAVNAEKLRIGSKVIIADSLGALKNLVDKGDKRNIHNLVKVYEETAQHRFKVDNGYDCEYALAYLVEEPAKLKWTDLKVGDVIRSKDGNSTALVTRIDKEDRTGYERHISIGFEWLDDTSLANWETVENA